MKKILTLLAASLLFTGCASVTHDSFQDMKVETLDQTGRTIDGAECVLSNDYGPVEIRSGKSARIHRSSTDLAIVCSTPNQEDAQGRAISRANAGLAGNILLGGGIGALVDHSNGRAYTYPEWIQLFFGQSAVYDRNHEKADKLTPATQVTRTTQAVTLAAAQTPVSVASPVPEAATPKAVKPISAVQENDTAERLKKLKELHDKGLITKEEFAEKRAKVLNAL